MASTRNLMLGATTPALRLTLETATGAQDLTGATVTLRFAPGGLGITATAVTATDGIVTCPVPTATQIAIGRYAMQAKVVFADTSVAYYPENDNFPVLDIRAPLATATA